MVEQKNIDICGIDVPIILDGDEIWYPIIRISRLILKVSSIVPMDELKTVYKEHIRNYDIKYAPRLPKKQTQYISEIRLIEILVRVDVKKLKVKDVVNRNKLHKYLGIFEIHITEDMLSKEMLLFLRRNLVDGIKIK